MGVAFRPSFSSASNPLVRVATFVPAVRCHNIHIHGLFCYASPDKTFKRQALGKPQTLPSKTVALAILYRDHEDRGVKGAAPLGSVDYRTGRDAFEAAVTAVIRGDPFLLL